MLRRRHTNSRRASKARNDNAEARKHLQFVRGFRCLADGDECTGKTEAHHIRSGTDGGAGLKPHCRFAVPLCSGCHMRLHYIGEAAFERRYRIDLKAAAEKLARISPHLKRMEKADG